MRLVEARPKGTRNRRSVICFALLAALREHVGHGSEMTVLGGQGCRSSGVTYVTRNGVVAGESVSAHFTRPGSYAMIQLVVLGIKKEHIRWL